MAEVATMNEENTNTQPNDKSHNNQVIQYLKFGAMILTSMIVMYILMYLNTYTLGHVRWSETRFYMTLIMGAAMAVIMLSFMLDMYRNRIVNGLIYATSIVMFVASLFLVRTQITVEDQSWMSAMIPHHSIAILTSERANITDLRVQELANGIIEAQRREIKEMNWLLQDIRENGSAETVEAAEARAVPSFEAESN